MKTKSLTVKVPVPTMPNVVRKVAAAPVHAAQTVGHKTSRAVVNVRAKQEIRKAQRDIDRLAKGKTWPEAFNGVEFDRLNAAFEAVVSRDYDDVSNEAAQDGLAYIQCVLEWSKFIESKQDRKLAKQAQKYVEALGDLGEAKATPEQKRELHAEIDEAGSLEAFAAKWLAVNLSR